MTLSRCNIRFICLVDIEFKRSKSKSNWNLEEVVFLEGGNQEKPDKNPRSKASTNNKLNRHETASTGIESGSQRWEASAYPLRQQRFPIAFKQSVL